MSKKTNNYYYDSFLGMTEFLHESAKYLHRIITEFDPEKSLEYMMSMHEIEHNADLYKHEVIEKLAREFLPPIESEDILLILNKLDDGIDIIEDVVRNIYMYNVRSVPEKAGEFTALIESSSEALKLLMYEFRNFKKTSSVTEYIMKINDQEEAGDVLQSKVLHKLYSDDSVSDKDIIRWTLIYNCLEDCLDACEEIADTVETVIMKNS